MSRLPSMSDARNSRDERRRRGQRRQVLDLLKSGKVLVASGDAPDQQGVRQTVSVELSAAGGVRVHVEHYRSWEWDRTLKEEEHHFPTVEAALEYLEKQRAVHWSQLHEPSLPR